MCHRSNIEANHFSRRGLHGICLPLLALLGALAASLVTGCAGHGSYVWFSQLPVSERFERPDQYLLKVGDTINVRVFQQEALSVSGKIRTDGRISLPFVGELVAAGRPPATLARDVEAKLKEFIITPRASVSVDQSAAVAVSVLGEVGNVGNLTLEAPATLIQAIAQAGGLSEYADDTAIFVMRRTPTQLRIRFTLDALLRNESGAASFPLKTGDVVVVE